jgi:site-specific recombinase XerD
MAMTHLRQRMIEDMQLRGFSPKTQEAYLRQVRQLVERCNKSPEKIMEEDLRDYFLYLKNEKGAARSTCTQALSAIKFFFEHTLKRDWKTFELVRPGKEKKLPVVLSQDEVRRVLGCLRSFRHHVCLSTIYSCGLRVSEGVNLQVAHLDSDRGDPSAQGQREQGSLRSLTRSYSGTPAPALEHASAPALVFSYAHTARCAPVRSYRTHVYQHFK